MVRLPIPGSDDGKWGEILNQYLSVSLDGSGELQQDSVGRDQLQADSVTSHAIANESIETAHLADGIVTTAKLSDTLQSSLASQVRGPEASSNEAIAIFDGTSGKLLKSIEGVTVGEGGGITATSMSLVKTGASAAQLYNRTDGAAAVFGAGLNQSVFSFDSAYSLEFRSASRSTVESRVLNSGNIRMKIDGATGNIGIGTTTPSYQLHVIGDQGLTGNLNFLSANKAMYFDTNNFVGHSTVLTDMHVTSGGSLYLNIDSNDNSTNAALFIGKDRTSNSGGTQLMKVTESGSVAIGTMTSPTEKLEVDGNVKVTGAMHVAGVQQANVYAGTTAPSSPVVGQIWIDTSGI